MDYKAMTIATYDASAQALATHFQSYGEAIKEIDQALSYIKHPGKAKVVEIGCGSGKHAAFLVERVAWYQGFDPSAKLLEIAQKDVSSGSFVQSDASSYDYPANLDAVFAFASMLHLDKSEFASVCSKVARALKPGGIFYMTLKEADKYQSKLQEDKFGQRIFYYYNAEFVAELAGPQFEIIFEDVYSLGPNKKPWLRIILRKVAA